MEWQKEYLLPAGTILDERYLITEILGEGGFGITYAGINKRVGVKVAIKELFSRSHMRRDSKESNQVFLLREEDGEMFQQYRRRFLKEARVVGDFAIEAGVVNVTDYFEANGTAYIVMEHLDGVTLKQWVEKDGVFEAADIFKKMIPLMETLEKIHSCGVIHRDISPDNIMILKDGTLKLMDFGAAQDFERDQDKSRSIVLKGGYAPREQYDRKGDQGPWTDIYALTATLYYCTTGQVPDDVLQRILHDELRTPAQMGISMDSTLEKVIMKGLNLLPEKRYGFVREMLSEIKKVFPEQQVENGRSRKKGLFFAGVAVCIIVFVVVGIVYVKDHLVEIKFHGIQTQTVVITSPEEMTTKEFYQAAEIVEERFRILAGEGNYIWREAEGAITVVTPYDIYEGKAVDYILKAYITRPIAMEICSVEDRKAYDLATEDIEKVEEFLGQDDLIEQIEVELPAEGDYRYLEMTLSDEKAHELSDYLKVAGNDIRLYQDRKEFSEMNCYNLSGVTKGDGKTVLLIDLDQEEKFYDLLVYNMNTDPFSQALSFEFERHVRWENAKESIVKGMYQCDEDELTGEIVQLGYTSYSEYPSDGAWYHMIAVAKRRMDGLKIPYAFGIGAENKQDLYLKVEVDKMWGGLAPILLEDGMQLKLTGEWEDIVTISDDAVIETIAADKDNGKAYSLRIKCESEYHTDEILKKTKENIDGGFNRFYLSFAGRRLMTCTLDEPIENGEIIFEELLFEDHKIMNEDTLALESFLHGLIGEKDVPKSYDLTSMLFYDEAGDIVTVEKELPYAIDLGDLEKVMDQIEALGGSADAKYLYPEPSLKIRFEVSGEKELAQMAMEKTEELHQILVALDGLFLKIDLIFEDEQQENRTVWLTFTKDALKKRMLLSEAYCFGSDETSLKDRVRTYLEETPFYQAVLAEDFWDRFKD